MSMEKYLDFSRANLWAELWPEIALCLGALIVLGIDLFSKNRNAKQLSGSFAVFFQLVLIAVHLLDYLLIRHTFDRVSFSGMLKHGIQQDLARTFFLISGMLVSVLAHRYLRLRKLRTGEFHHLVMLASAGLMLLCQTQHFVIFFVALEAVALCFYPLVAFDRESTRSLEAGIKYLIFGALSSTLLLLGIVLLFGVGSNPEYWGASLSGEPAGDPLSFAFLFDLLSENPEHPLLRSGVVLVLIGIAFKVGAAPFQIWVPDVYHGSPLPITAFLAVSSKAAGFFILLALLNGPFAGMTDFLLPLLSFVATLTIFFGNLAACSQRNLKRILGLSGVAHAGYLMVAVMASMLLPGESDRAVWILFFYLFTYLLSSYAVFGVMSLASGDTDSEHELVDYQDLANQCPWAAFVLVIGLASLAGIPPLAGFIGKALLLSVAFETKLHLSIVAMVIGVVVSIYYYFGWIRAVCFHPPKNLDEDEPKVNPWSNLAGIGLQKIFLLCLAATSIVFGLWQGSFGDAF